MGEVLRFMLILGPLSSAFDLLTFLALRQGFGVDVEQFRTAWFLESMATQILVIFVIRTRMPAWQALPHPFSTTTSLAALLAAMILALTPLGSPLGFTSLPTAGSVGRVVDRRGLSRGRGTDETFRFTRP